MMRGPLMRMRVDFLLLGFESPVGYPVVKQRDKKHRQKCRREHTADHAGAHRVARASTRAAGNRERQYAKNKRERGHQNGATA